MDAVSLALSRVAGAALILDRELRIVAASEAAAALLGDPSLVGARAASALCGTGDRQPIAEALAAGRPATGTVVRPRPSGGEVAIRVHAEPLSAGSGWLLRLREDAPSLSQAGAIHFHGILTADPAMKRMLHVIERAAASNVTVLLRGETGTGKELLARAVHALSPRAEAPMRAINCAALSPTLLESELFGHVRGAFTGALRDNPGHFRHADGGTLFLDEVAEMPADLQAKLLRVIETSTVIPVGAMDPIQVDVRLIAATHKSLRAEVAAGRFRADLMYRLRKVPVFIPPLRNRGNDIELLARHFAAQLSARADGHPEPIAADALAALVRYSWPGNVRELANALEYAFVVGDGPLIHATDLPPEIADPAHSPDAGLDAPVNAGPVNAPRSEADRIARALERAGGNKTRAAKLLGISRVTLWRKLRESELAN